eukprot:RCo020767
MGNDRPLTLLLLLYGLVLLPSAAGTPLNPTKAPPGAEPDFSAGDANAVAKNRLFANLSLGSGVRYYELSETAHPLQKLYPWQKSSMFVLGALMASGLPFLEVLVYIRPRRPKMDPRNTLCYAAVPSAAVRCAFPSGHVVNASAQWPSASARASQHRYYKKKIGVTTSKYYCGVPEEVLRGLPSRV